MGTQSTKNESLFIPKAYNKQAINELISGKTDVIVIELEHTSARKPVNVATSLTIAQLSGKIETDIVIPLYSYQLNNDELVLLFLIDDKRIPLDQQKELRRITSPIDLVGGSILDLTISFNDADCIVNRYVFSGEWHKTS